MKNALIFISFLLIALTSCNSNQNPVLKIEGGLIQGVATETTGIYVYKGVPYSAPPVGDLRWKAPQPVIPWEGVKVADQYGPAAIQAPRQPGSFYHTEFFTVDGHQVSEDCLYLNIYTSSPGKTNAAYQWQFIFTEVHMLPVIAMKSNFWEVRSGETWCNPGYH